MGTCSACGCGQPRGFRLQWGVSLDQLLCQKAYTLDCGYLYSAGICSAYRILKEAIPKGPTQGLVGKLGEMLPEYYQLRGWSTEGEPTEAKLVEQGIL